MSRIMLWLVLFSFVILPFDSIAQEKSLPQKIEILITSTVEEGQKILLATVTRDGEPLEGVHVNFFVERTFGLLLLGKEETLDDGTAAVPFPIGLPGDGEGNLKITAEIASPSENTLLRGTTIVSGGIKRSFEEHPFPRALWSPKAPIPLVATIATLLLIVWSTYMYVIVQLVKIKKGGNLCKDH